MRSVPHRGSGWVRLVNPKNTSNIACRSANPVAIAPGTDLITAQVRTFEAKPPPAHSLISRPGSRSLLKSSVARVSGDSAKNLTSPEWHSYANRSREVGLRLQRCVCKVDEL